MTNSDIYKSETDLLKTAIENNNNIIATIKLDANNKDLSAADKALAISNLPDFIKEGVALTKCLNEFNKVADNDNMKEQLRELIKRENIYVVPETGKYHALVSKNNAWSELSDDGLRKQYPMIQHKYIELFNSVLAEESRQPKGVYFGLTDKANYLNILPKSEFLKPKNLSIEVNEVFDILFEALSGGRKYELEHIIKCILRKVVNPSDRQIPSICWYGEGGIGKDTLIKTILHTIFSNKTCIISAEDITGQFNSMISGQFVALVNETTQDKLNMGALKNLIGSDEIQIKVKYKSPYLQENFLWLLFGSNNDDGSIRLDRNQSDRRFSIIKSLRGFSMNDIFKRRYPGQDFKTWMAINRPFLEDAEQIQQWLWNLEHEYGVQKTAPTAFHGKDYKEIVEQQKNIDEIVFDVVMRKMNIDGCTVNQLYALYKDNDGLLTIKRFGKRIQEHIVKHNLTWIKKNATTSNKKIAACWVKDGNIGTLCNQLVGSSGNWPFTVDDVFDEPTGDGLTKKTVHDLIEFPNKSSKSANSVNYLLNRAKLGGREI